MPAIDMGNVVACGISQAVLILPVAAMLAEADLQIAAFSCLSTTAVCRPKLHDVLVVV